MSQTPNEPSENRQTHIDLLALDFKNVEVPCDNYVDILTNKWWWVDESNESEMDVLLAEMCQMLLGYVTMLILDKIEPQVTAHRHVRVPEVAASTSADTYLDPLLSGCSYCRVTKQDVEACFGNTLTCCFRQLLSVVQNPFFDSVKLSTLFSAEVAKRVNSVLSFCTGPARMQSDEPSDSVAMEMVNNVISIIKTCKTPDTSKNQSRTRIIYDMMDDKQNSDHSSHMHEYYTDNYSSETRAVGSFEYYDDHSSETSAEGNFEYYDDHSSWSSAETSTEGSAEGSSESITEDITENIVKTSAEGSSENITEDITENIVKTSAETSVESQTVLRGVEIFLTLFLAKLISYIAKKTHTSVVNIDFEQIVTGVKERFMKDQSYTLPQNVQKLQKPVYKELKQHFGSKYELQYRMAKAAPSFMALVAITLEAQLKKTEKPKKIWRIFKRNSKVHIYAAESHSKENEMNGSAFSHQHNRHSNCFTRTFASIFNCLRKAFT